MKALVFDGALRLQSVPRPRPGPGEALVRVLSAGICNTDLEITRGYMGFEGILGHEFVGEVEESASAHLRGKRVVGEINCVCHTCRFCRLEMPHHCLNRTVLGILNRDGAFAEYLVLPEENLHEVPHGVPDDKAVFAEPLAAAFRILEQIEIEPADRVVVLGDGKLGQLIAQVLHTRSKNLVCVGRTEAKLDLLKRQNITTAHVDELFERGGADVVVEATGSHEGFGRAIELVRPEGTIVLKSTVAHPVALDMSLPVVNEIKVIGSRCGPFRPALDALANGAAKVRPMITESYDLSDGVRAMERAGEPGVLKVLLHV